MGDMLHAPLPPTPLLRGAVMSAASSSSSPGRARVPKPFCTLSHSRKISSPPRQLPEFRFTRQILSSAVLGAPEGVGVRKGLNPQRRWASPPGPAAPP